MTLLKAFTVSPKTFKALGLFSALTFEGTNKSMVETGLLDNAYGLVANALHYVDGLSVHNIVADGSIPRSGWHESLEWTNWKGC